jgi:hypothetical protein
MHPRPCRTDGCTRPALPRRTLCATCRYRTRRHGSPHATVRTTLDPHEVDTAVARRAFPPGLTEAERIAVGRRLTELGYSISQIAALSGASTRAVSRWRATART